ncbi:hypothetical protein ABID16_003296 [Rhizobium aquaticum]|uniref:O-antigen ligase-related domain-containing protein n=1 Tax=Rhizobium aquaticum TaxID=1549636 RepID=A0ABV2J2F9_9HYPH
MLKATVVLAALLALWACSQALRFEGNPFANPVWKSASEVLGALPGSISIVPADTLATIIPVLLPFAVFTTGVLLFQSDASATRLLRFLAISGGLVALYGLIQFEFFPDYLMFRKKDYYLDDLTSVLVNRNSIATYLGAALLINAGFLFDSLIPVSPRRGRAGAAFHAQRLIQVDTYSVLHGFLAFVTLLALLLTRSRGGIAATFVALSALSVFLVIDGYWRIGQRTRRPSNGMARPSKWASVSVAAAFIVLIFFLLGGRVLMRADMQGAEDARFCAYPSIVQLLKDNWLFGTGLGSFREAYERYQDPLCAHNRLWDRAHSFYLEGWIDLGVIFVPLLLVAVGGLILIFISGIKNRKSRRWASASGASVLLLFLLHSIVDFSIQIPGVAVFFAAIMAAASVLSLNRVRRNGVRQKRGPDGPNFTGLHQTS